MSEANEAGDLSSDPMTCSPADGPLVPIDACRSPAANDVCSTCGADALQLAAYDDVFWCPECGTLLGDHGPWVPKRLKDTARHPDGA